MMGEAKSGFSLMLGIVRIVGGDAEQVQHPAGGGAAQRAQKADGTIIGHGNPRDATNMARKHDRFRLKDCFTAAIRGA